MFTATSGLVIVWVGLIRVGTYTEDQVPALSNLRDMVHQALNEGANT